MDAQEQIRHNINAHNKICGQYEKIHGEIFNSVEQERIFSQLKRALSLIKTSSSTKRALDYGCGSGNLTKHLVDLGFYVISADISNKFLEMITERYAKTRMSGTLKINGSDLSQVPDGSFDFFGSYSVLHHVPDYLKIIEEASRVVRPGGVIYLDHEGSENDWNPSKEYVDFLKLAKKIEWGKYLKPSNYINKIHRIIDSSYAAEGDIHTKSGDHVEWGEIKRALVKNNCEIVFEEEYLLCKSFYRQEVYQNYKDKCKDMYVLMARKK